MKHEKPFERKSASYTIMIVFLIFSLTLIKAEKCPLTSQLKESIIKKKWGKALSGVDELRRKSPKLYTNNHFYLLHAWLLEKTGKIDQAILLLETWKKEEKLLPDYILWKLGNLYSLKGKSIEGRACFYQLVRKYKRSPYFDGSLFSLGVSYENDLKLFLASNTFISYLKTQKRRQTDARLHLGKIRIKQEKWSLAWQNLKKILLKRNAGTFAIKSALLIASEPELLKKCSSSFKSYSRLISLLIANRKLSIVSKLLDGLSKLAKDNEKKAQCYWLKGRYYFLKGKLKTSEKFFNLAISKNHSKYSLKALLSLCRILSLKNNHALAFSTLSSQLKKHSKYRRNSLVWLTLDNLATKLSNNPIKNHYLEMGLRYTNGQNRLNLAYKLAYRKLLSNNFTSAIKFLKYCMNNRYANYKKLPTPAELAFYLGYAYYRSGDYKKALNYWSRYIFEEDNYFSLLSMKKARELAKQKKNIFLSFKKNVLREFLRASTHNEQKRAFIHLRKIYLLDGKKNEFLKDLRKIDRYYKLYLYMKNISVINPKKIPVDKKNGQDTILLRAWTFQNLGLARGASLEYLRCSTTHLASVIGLSSTEASLKRAFTIATLYSAQRMYHKAFQWSHRIMNTPSVPFPFFIYPKRVLKLCYPTVYKKQIFENCHKYKVPPWFTYGLILQESRFDPGARSSVSAFGLMQLMPYTARKVAKEFNIKLSLDDEELLLPDKNIKIGISHLSQLIKRFSTLTVVAAAYNAGSKQAIQWKDDIKSDIDLFFIPRITFLQTRRYVENVMANYFMYSYLYGNSFSKPLENTTH